MGSEGDISLPSGSTNWGTAAVRAVDYTNTASASKGVAAEGLAIATIGVAAITNNSYIWGIVTKSDKPTV